MEGILAIGGGLGAQGLAAAREREVSSRHHRSAGILNLSVQCGRLRRGPQWQHRSGEKQSESRGFQPKDHDVKYDGKNREGAS